MPPPRPLLEHLALVAGVDADDISRDDTLPDLGIDSIRLMSLVDTWRADGLPLSFADAASRPRVADLLDFLIGLDARTRAQASFTPDQSSHTTA